MWVNFVHREMQLAEMGIALHIEGGALGVFSPKNVSVLPSIDYYRVTHFIFHTDPSFSKPKWRSSDVRVFVVLYQGGDYQVN